MNVIIEPIYGNAEHYQETYDPSYTPAQLYGVEGSLADNAFFTASLLVSAISS